MDTVKVAIFHVPKKEIRAFLDEVLFVEKDLNNMTHEELVDYIKNN